MKKAEVIKLLKENQNKRGLEHWNKLDKTGGLDSFGIGLTQLRKLARKIGRDHLLALELWQTNNYDVKTIALLIDDPKLMTQQQAEAQVEELGIGMLTHVFSSCDATLAKTSFAFDIAKSWIESEHDLRRQCGYGLIYELSKNKRNKALSDEFFQDCIERINRTIKNEKRSVRSSMGGALIGIGKRNKQLNFSALKVAKIIGLIDFNEIDSTNKCEPLNIVKHLTSDYLTKKLGL